MWYVYIIQNVMGIYYCGITTNILYRLEQHNGTKSGGAKFTKRGRPWKTITYRQVSSRSEALKLEAKVKKVKKNEKISLLDNYVP